jgi:hypothetical protein
LDLVTRRAVVDALEGRALLFGSEAPSGISPDANGRLSTSDLGVALAKFDEQTRTIVKSVLLQVGGTDNGNSGRPPLPRLHLLLSPLGV